jgi:4-amino-4-deoxy-L-arabinose transferase-like glycosyltransferase
MTDSLNYRKYIWLVLLTTLALRILGMWLLPLTDTTEARYGEIARKMVETGNWVTPLHNYDVSRDVCAATACISLPSHDFGLPFWAKPPLSTWASAVSMTIFGVNEFAARFFIVQLRPAWPALLLAETSLGRAGARGGHYSQHQLVIFWIRWIGNDRPRINFLFGACNGELLASIYRRKK